jgi:hypothetical protein
MPGFSSPEFDKEPLVQVMPNPIVENMRIISNESIKQVKIIDSQGQTLMDRVYNTNVTEQIIDVSHLPSGAFSLIVTSADFTKQLRIIKAR